MFSRLSLLTLATPLAYALQLNIPKNPRSNEPVNITWTPEFGDPSIFSLELVNEQFHNAFAIANNVLTIQQAINIALPSVPIGGGYTLEAVNIGDINDVFASSGGFSISSPNTSVTTLSAVSTGTSNSQLVSTVTGPSPGASNTASAPNSAQPDTISVISVTSAALSSFGANKGVVAAALLPALAGAAVLAL